MLFNIGLIGLFYECEDSDIANYADYATPYACGENIQAVISELQSLAFRLFNWSGNIHIMKANSRKSHILLSNKKTEKVAMNNVCTNLKYYSHSELKFEKHNMYL